MSTMYRLAYRIGLTPWERAGAASAAHFSSLLEREERDRTPPLGSAMDLGCGTGAHALELAGRGWQVTGVDSVARAIDTARDRARASGAEVRFVEADVTDLQAAAVGSDYRFFLDVGCFHGLNNEQRAAMGRGVTAVATDDATLLMLAFLPGRRPLLPRGASSEQILEAFPGWVVLDETAAETAGMPRPLRSAAPRWYRLGRRRG